jgi:hypothetical protein
MLPPTNLALYQGLLYQLDRFGAPTFEVPEFNYWWNFATRKFVNKTLEVFDLTQKVSDALRVLTTPGEEILNAVDTDTDVRKIDLPEEYFRLLNCILTIRFKEARECFSKGDKTQHKGTRMTSDLESFALNNTYHKPQWDRPYYKVVGSELLLMIDTADFADNGIVIEKINFDYIKGPNVVKLYPTFDANDEAPEEKCEFPEEITDEITKICLKLIVERQGDVQRLQSNTSLDMN